MHKHITKNKIFCGTFGEVFYFSNYKKIICPYCKEEVTEELRQSLYFYIKKEQQKKGFKTKEKDIFFQKDLGDF